MDHVQRAKELFLQGYNCAQSVAGAFADEAGVSFETAVKVAGGFGGGVGRMREVCGAVCGMTAIVGLIMDEASDPKKKVDVYAVVQELAGKYREKNGSIVCHELLALPTAQKLSPTPEARTESYYKKRPCLELVADAAEILENWLKDRQKAV